MMLYAIRGAICAENSSESIWGRTRELLEEILRANTLDIDNIVSIIFTCTKDLNQAYPAVSAREMGILHASLMCMAEMDVVGSMEGCIRVQVMAYMGVPQNQVKHIYMGRARALRPDIVEGVQNAE